MTYAEIEMVLRTEWWFNHGCDRRAIYGDDGEMQCNSGVCRFTDFLRMPIDELHARVKDLRQRALIQALREHVAEPPA